MRDRLHGIACHESGHAVAAFCQGRRILSLSLVPTEADTASCWTEANPRVVEALALLQAARERAAELSPEEAAAVADRCRELLDPAAPENVAHSRAAAVQALAGVYAGRRAGLEDEEGESVDRETAAALVGALAGQCPERSEALLKAVWAEACALVDRHSEAVLRLAGVLLERRKMDGAEVEALLSSWGGKDATPHFPRLAAVGCCPQGTASLGWVVD